MLGVSSYGISVTTMEEVFMKVREGADETLRHRLSPNIIPIATLYNCTCRDVCAYIYMYTYIVM